MAARRLRCSGVSATDHDKGDGESDDGVRRHDRETTRRAEPDVVVPLLRLEKAYMPSEKDIVEAARRVVHFQ